MDKQSDNGILEDFRIEFLDCWQRLPNKGFFLILLAAWLALFQFLGNSTLGYISTPSLLRWMYLVYQPSTDPGASDEAHGNIVPFIVLALMWWKRKQLLALELRLWWPALLLVGLALLLHVVGYLGQQPRISIVALFTGIYALMGVAWGRQWLRESIFPFFLFVFCIPLGWSAGAVTFPMRLLVCRVVEVVSAYVFQIDVARVGTALIDPTGQYQYDVAPACSGIRSLFATLAVATIYAFLSYKTWWKRALLIAAGFPLAVLGNVVRMLTIVIAAEIGGPKAGNYVHEGGPSGILSLLPYIAAFAGLLLLGHWLRTETSKPALPEAKAA
jgi:exosortase